MTGVGSRLHSSAQHESNDNAISKMGKSFPEKSVMSHRICNDSDICGNVTVRKGTQQALSNPGADFRATKNAERIAIIKSAQNSRQDCRERWSHRGRCRSLTAGPFYP